MTDIGDKFVSVSMNVNVIDIQHFLGDTGYDHAAKTLDLFP
jgi:hypothetical protein